MALWMQISSGSETPIYQQLVEQISGAIARGELRTGDKLPAVRALAAELVINPNTVARAYMLLEQSGLVTTKTGSGTFVSDPALRQADAAQINILAERMDTLISRAVNLGLDRSALVALFEKRLEKFAGTLDKGKAENG
ncbi:MAG: GntR family transcriptional regulator [Sedimentisphaerales bacterium]|jgi:GntR family transcriptional regulator|nr:GntR family transcriptional regulator [Sedimentisphaerales bacterium]HNY79896.1 GntR family transcriptional regulator [Sedimentisphaerales bacterium]HOC64995.1 GntR family transcriptional regulator [Sedimentisphaerales bacterium]HOH63296.1 GntR family transcriptional regulator [Sedimentisphaerales bacterium]HPY49104.1 GntR family transcriptional regulator [Sedimentisphaerales bacterium]